MLTGSVSLEKRSASEDEIEPPHISGPLVGSKIERRSVRGAGPSYLVPRYDRYVIAKSGQARKIFGSHCTA